MARRKKQSDLNIDPRTAAGIFVVIGFYAFYEALVHGQLWAILVAIAIGCAAFGFIGYFFYRKYRKVPIPTVTIEEIDKMDPFEFEEFVGDLFRAQGYRVEVTPQSHDYGADVIVKKDRVKTVIQVKHYANNVTYDAIKEVLAGKAFHRADKAMVVTNASSFTSQVLNSANKVGIELVGRNELKKLVHKYLPYPKTKNEYQE